MRRFSRVACCVVDAVGSSSIVRVDRPSRVAAASPTSASELLARVTARRRRRRRRNRRHRDNYVVIGRCEYYKLRVNACVSHRGGGADGACPPNE